MRMLSIFVAAMIVLGCCTADTNAFWSSYGSAGSYASTGGASTGSVRYRNVSYGSTASYGATSYSRVRQRVFDRSSASYGSNASYGSVSNGSSASYGNVGPIRRLVHRIAARRAARFANSRFTNYGCASYGSTASYGSASYASTSSASYGSTPFVTSFEDCDCSTDASYSTGTYETGTVYEETSGPHLVPVEEIITKPTPADGAMIQLKVPAGAKVYINDFLTKSTGTERSYVSRNLVAGKTYQYNVRVETTYNGKPVVRAQLVSLAIGQVRAFAYQAPATKKSLVSKKSQIATILKINVPSDARVFLAGHATSEKGAARQYKTTKLASGQSWKKYTVKVQVVRNGKTLTQEREISLVGGETQALAFEFEMVQLAQL